MSWKIRKKVGVCQGCERKFLDAELHFSVLQISGEELGREDRCLECWKRYEIPTDAIFWKTQHFISPQKKRAIDFEGLREVFLQLSDRREPAQASLYYLVTLLLVRKKILKIRELKRSANEEILVVGFTRSRELYEIPIPDLSPEKLEPLKQELKVFFGDNDEPNPASSSVSSEATATSEGVANSTPSIS